MIFRNKSCYSARVTPNPDLTQYPDVTSFPDLRSYPDLTEYPEATRFLQLNRSRHFGAGAYSDLTVDPIVTVHSNPSVPSGLDAKPSDPQKVQPSGDPPGIEEVQEVVQMDEGPEGDVLVQDMSRCQTEDDVRLLQGALEPTSSLGEYVDYLQSGGEKGMLCSVLEEGSEDSRPHAEVYVDERRAVGLLDSGSHVTLVGKNGLGLVEKCPVEYLPSPVFVKSASDSLHSCCQVAKVPYRYAGQTIVVPTLILPDLPRKLILGVDFWRAFGIAPELFGGVVGQADEVDLVEREMVVGEVGVPRPESDHHELTPAMLDELTSAKQRFLTSTDEFIGCTPLIQHRIDTPSVPLGEGIRQKPYTFSPHEQPAVDAEIERMLRLGIISRIQYSSWCSPLVKVKKANGSLRICIDARRLNEVTKKNAYPLPHMTRIFQNMRPGRFYAKIDLSAAFWQIPLHPDSKEKTAFGVVGRGLFQYERMPFGVYGAPGTLAFAMDTVLGYDLEPYVFYYLDDIIIIADTWGRFIQLLHVVADRLRAANLSINLEKSEFALKQVEYCGFIVDERGRRPNIRKTDPIVRYPRPNTKQELKRFMGMVNYLGVHIADNYSDVVAPLNGLLKGRYVKSAKLSWNLEAERAFCEIKEKIARPVLLAQPDFEKTFYVQTDASGLAAAGFIYQVVGGQKRVIEFMSKKFSPEQSRYGACERELLALLLAIEKFRPYVEGVHFKAIIDNSALQYLRRINNPSGRLTRWAMRLMEFDFEVIHLPGSENKVPDALSRAIDEMTLVEDPKYEKLKERVLSDPQKNSNMKVEDGVLFKACNAVSPSSGLRERKWKIYVPEHKQAEVLKKCHDDAVHLGQAKTLKRIQEWYTWPKMEQTVASYVKKCEVCRKAKTPNVNLMPPVGKMKEASRPFELLMLDFVGPLPRSKNGNNCLLVISDFFSKFVILKPMRDQCAERLTRFVEDEIFLKFGIPNKCLNDNGPCFRSATWKKLLEAYGVKHHLIANYTPQVNNVERVNRVIGESLRAMIGFDHREWDQFCPRIAWALNTAVHESTKLTPFMILFGQPSMLTGKNHEMALRDEGEGTKTLERRQKDLEAVRGVAQANLRLNYERFRAGYDLRKRARQFQEGQLVYRRNFAQSNKSKNLTAKFLDRFVQSKVVRHCGPNAVLLADMSGKEVGVFHLKDVFAA